MEETNSWFNLINEEPNIDKIYLHAKDLFEPKYQFLINKREITGLNHFNDYKAFTECYSIDIDYIYKTLKNTIRIRSIKY